MAACLLCAVGSVRAHQRLFDADAARPSPTGDVAGICARWLAATPYHSVLADSAYLQAISVYGSKAAHRAAYPRLGALLERACALDPKFAAPYLFAATSLSLPNVNPQLALALLEQGCAKRPDEWRICFYYGFELMERGRYADAARAMSVAAQHPRAPPYIPGVAARLATEAHDPTIGLQMLDGLREQTHDPDELRAIAERRAPLVYEQQLVAWHDALVRYAQRTGYPPQQLGDVASDAERRLPRFDPWGAPYRLEADGAVASGNAHRRLRLHRPGEHNVAP